MQSIEIFIVIFLIQNLPPIRLQGKIGRDSK
jgi:hypothetical protein